MKIQILTSKFKALSQLLTVFFLAVSVPRAYAQEYDPNTLVYCDRLWLRVHAADCPELILKEEKQTITLAEADLEGWRIGESGQSGRIDCCLHGYQREHPQRPLTDDTILCGDNRANRYKHTAGCHRYWPVSTDMRRPLSEWVAEGFAVSPHCIERGPIRATVSDEEWAKLPSGEPFVPPAGWQPQVLSPVELPPQEEIDVIVEQVLHQGNGIQERVFTDPIATVENFMIIRFFFPVEQWLHLYKVYRTTGDKRLLDKLLESARHYNQLSTEYLSAAQMKARDPEGMAFMYSMAVTARITLQLARKHPEEVSAADIAEAEAFLNTIIAVLEPACEGDDNLDPVMGIPQDLANDFRSRAFNRAINGIGTIGTATAALQDLHALKNTTEYQPTIDRYRKVVQEYIKHWKSVGELCTYEGEDYFSYPYSATDTGFMQDGVKLFNGPEDQGHFSHTLQGVYLLYDALPEVGVDDNFMTAIANAVYFNSYTRTSGSIQCPQAEAIRPYSRQDYGAARDRFYLLEAFKDGIIDGQCCTLSTAQTEAVNRGYEHRLETLHIHYLKALREDRSLIYLGDERSLIIAASPQMDYLVGQPIPLLADVLDSHVLNNLDSVVWDKVSGPGEAVFSDSSALDTSVTFSAIGTYRLRLTVRGGTTTHSATTTLSIVDTVPPTPRTGLVARAGAGCISLNWEDNAEADLAAYLVYRSETAGSDGVVHASSLLSSNFVDGDVEPGKPYFYRIVALDSGNNVSGPSTQASAVATATVQSVFGSENDGWGWFASGTSDSANTAWNVEPLGVRFTNDGGGNSGQVNSSLLAQVSVDRTEGSDYTLTGVAHLLSTYGADNNRLGMTLFATSGGVAGIDTGLSLQVNLFTGQMSIRSGVNGGAVASVDLAGVEAVALIGETLTFTATAGFVGEAIEIEFTLHAPGLAYTQSLNTTVAAADYAGEYFGFSTRGRVRGTDTRVAPFIYETVSFAVTKTNPNSIVDTNANGIDDDWELRNFGGLLEDDTLHDGVPYYFLYLSGWTSEDDVAQAGWIQIALDSNGTSPVVFWDFGEGFEMNVHAEVWMSTDLDQWMPLPPEHFIHTTTPTPGGKTRHELTVTHDYGDKIFLRLQKPMQ